VQDFFLTMSVILGLAMVLPFYRVAAGPTVYDRILGAGVIGTKTIGVISLVGFVFGRMDMFVDIAIAYAVLNFIGVIAIAKYLEMQEEERRQ